MAVALRLACSWDDASGQPQQQQQQRYGAQLQRLLECKSDGNEETAAVVLQRPATAAAAAAAAAPLDIHVTSGAGGALRRVAVVVSARSIEVAVDGEYTTTLRGTRLQSRCSLSSAQSSTVNDMSGGHQAITPNDMPDGHHQSSTPSDVSGGHHQSSTPSDVPDHRHQTGTPNNVPDGHHQSSTQSDMPDHRHQTGTVNDMPDGHHQSSIPSDETNTPTDMSDHRHQTSTPNDMPGHHHQTSTPTDMSDHHPSGTASGPVLCEFQWEPATPVPWRKSLRLGIRGCIGDAATVTVHKLAITVDEQAQPALEPPLTAGLDVSRVQQLIAGQELSAGAQRLLAQVASARSSASADLARLAPALMMSLAGRQPPPAAVADPAPPPAQPTAAIPPPATAAAPMIPAMMTAMVQQLQSQLDTKFAALEQRLSAKIDRLEKLLVQTAERLGKADSVVTTEKPDTQ